MNINEVEVVTGLTRANIRYYEKEGLIEVERLDNKYRNYSSENIRELRKIILLRRLGFSVDAIRKMKNSETDMQAELKDRIGPVSYTHLSHFFVQVLSRRLSPMKLKLAKSSTKLSFAPQTLSRQRLLTSLKKSLKQLTLKKLKLSLPVAVA